MVDTTTSSVTSVLSTSSTTATEATSNNDLASQEVFIELLMTQMQYQDPLDPMDNQEFLSQIAQLSTVEQLRNANTQLETLQLYQMSINNAQAVSMIGKTVKAAGDAVNLSAGEGSLSFELAQQAEEVNITIYNGDGEAIRSVTLSGMDEGVQHYTWDGRNDDNSPLEDGEYSFTVSAEDENGNAITVDTFISGVVSGISFDDGYPVLHVGTQEVTMGEVYEVMQE